MKKCPLFYHGSSPEGAAGHLRTWGEAVDFVQRPFVTIFHLHDEDVYDQAESTVTKRRTGEQMRSLSILLVLSALTFGQEGEVMDPEPEPAPAAQIQPVMNSLPDIAPFFRIGAGLGVQVHQGGTWTHPWSSEAEWHGGEWEGFDATVTNLSMGVLIRPADVAVTLDNTTAWFNTQGFWGDDPFMSSSITALMGTYYPSENWSVGGGGGLFLLGTPFNDNGTLSGPGGMISAGRRIADDVFVEGRVFLGLIRQDHSLMSDAKTVIGINVVVNADLAF